MQDLIEQTVPLSQPSERAQPWWDAAVAEAVQAERQAQRQWSRTQSYSRAWEEQKWREFQGTSAEKRKIIAKAKQAHWMAGVHKAATSTEGIWKLAKWARTKSHLPKEPAKMPNF
jgi:hypothetical protein